MFHHNPNNKINNIHTYTNFFSEMRIIFQDNSKMSTDPESVTEQ